jgi:hypothetical protein
MLNYYRISDPNDVRGLGDQMAAWIADGNPKADAWAEQPEQPDPAATWRDGFWVMPDPPSRETLFPNAENYQLRAWMIRGALDPDLVPAIIAQVVPEQVPVGEIGQKEALMRWDYAVRVPRDFPLVDVIGAQMGLTREQIDAAWPTILAL